MKMDWKTNRNRDADVVAWLAGGKEAEEGGEAETWVSALVTAARGQDETRQDESRVRHLTRVN